MATVRDPNFWKRFSIAVHQDDALKEELAKSPNLKHSYVTTLTLEPSEHKRTPSSTSSPLAIPTSQTLIMDPAPAPAPAPPPPPPPPPALERPFPKFSTHPKPMSPIHMQPVTPTKALSSSSSSSKPIPLNLSRTHTHSSEAPMSPRTPTTPLPAHTFGTPTRLSFASKFTRHANASTMSVGFSGRPQSRFKFWTSVTADPPRRDSWLEGQQRKRKQRAYMCWGFWLGLLLIVAGVVAAVLILKNKGIL